MLDKRFIVQSAWVAFKYPPTPLSQRGELFLNSATAFVGCGKERTASATNRPPPLATGGRGGLFQRLTKKGDFCWPLAKIFSCLFLLSLIILLNACAVHQSPLENVDELSNAETQLKWESHRALVSSIDSWKIRGKIAVKAGSKGGHASLRWDRNKDIQHIELFGPLGGGRVVIDADAEGAHLQDTKGGDMRGESIARLVEQRLGWPLPFDQLPFWLRGLPTGEEAKIEWDELGQVARMNDSGWQVSYLEYQAMTSVDGRQMQVPRQVELNALPGTLHVYDKKGEYLGEDFFIRLIVKSWLP